MICRPLSLLRRPFEVFVAVDELQIELEPVDLPAAVPFDQMVIITSHKDPGGAKSVLTRLISSRLLTSALVIHGIYSEGPGRPG